MKLASVENIKNLEKHPNADLLDIAEVLGWQTVVKKDIHKIGDKVIFIPIDTILPKTSWSEDFTDKENPNKPIRIKNIKLRGHYSSGIILPIKLFPEFINYEGGTDVGDMLGIQKYIKEIPANLSGESSGDFPTSIISKTDEDNGLSNLELVEKVLSHNFITITQKYDGSSITIIVENGEIVNVCSRNLSKKDTENSTFWNAAKKLYIPSGWTGCIQGELCGNGIQSNRMGLENIEIYVFQIMCEYQYFSYEKMKEFCENELKCKVVPLVLTLENEANVKMWTNPLKKLQELADKQLYPNKKQAEGIVVRPSNYPRGYSSRRPLGFKLINRNYKD